MAEPLRSRLRATRRSGLTSPERSAPQRRKAARLPRELFGQPAAPPSARPPTGPLPSALTPVIDDAPALAAAAERPLIVEQAMSALASRFPPLNDYTSSQRARTGEDLDYIFRFVEASLVTGDDTITTSFARGAVGGAGVDGTT